MKFNSKLIKNNRVKEILYKIRSKFSNIKYIYRELLITIILKLLYYKYIQL